jgi:hypothetical protein
MWAVRGCLTLVAVVVLAVPAIGQSVISTHSGVIYYFDGSVYLGDQPLEAHLGKFPSVPEGASLRTAQGHAEVVLTPGVFLRMGENTSIRMLSNDLANTQVELQTGSVIVDSSESTSDAAIKLVFRNWEVRSAKPGTYRVDSEPPRLWVLKGTAEVVGGARWQPVTVQQGMDLPFAAVLVPEQSRAAPTDDLSDWAQGRSDSILADDAITQQIDADTTSQTPDLDGFIHFPIVGLPLAGTSSSLYSSLLPNQPGFYSMYLPGYTSAPLLFVMMGPRIGLRFPVYPVRVGNPRGVGGVAMPRPIIPRPVMPYPTPHPVMPHPVGPRPVAAPAHPIAIHR